MFLREMTEELERQTLSPYAALSADSRGRQRPMEPCQIRTCYQRDIDRILHSKSFRRLMHKTQVFLQPEGDHYRTRMTHTLEVLRVVDRLEKGGEGLNLCYEVRRGILCHTGPDRAETLEGQIVRVADKIAYINHDIDDAMRGGIIYPLDIPLDISQVLGFDHGGRINTLTGDVIQASQGKGEIVQSPACGQAMARLRQFMFEAVYHNPLAKGEESKAQDMIARLFEFYQQNPDDLPPDYQDIRAREGVDRAVCDYIAGMTDNYAVAKYSEAFIPLAWSVK